MLAIGSMSVATEFVDFVNHELLPRLPMSPETFWQGLEALLDDFTPRNVELLSVRDRLQAQIDDWHRARQGQDFDAVTYRQFLIDIGYLQPEVPDFQIETDCVDDEIALQAGPQLVVPVKNGRFALNAANARWGSLYDALYGTDAIPDADGADRAGSYNPVRGLRVIAFAREFLDQSCSLQQGSHSAVTRYWIADGALRVALPEGDTGLADASQCVGYTGSPDAPTAILLRNNNLHIELIIDPQSAIGCTDRAGVADVVLEAAVTTIQDCEDSVAAVDAADKVAVYRNWLGLITGDLSERFIKGDREITRSLHADRTYTTLTGDSLELPGRSLLLIRNVGHLMRNPTLRDRHGQPVFEGLLDALLTSAIGAIDIRRGGRLVNSRAGSIYIVKPKMHGPDEVAFTNALFERVETLLQLPANTIKLGIMDEERRTSVNLKNCIHAARHRVVFINTGFLDRTGDEIHTSMEAGPMLPKGEMKSTPWIKAYEDNNVDVGLRCGFQGRAQIGKGMWAMPDLMARMLEEKIAHPQAGANTAWVPSPTAAVLHALHYHRIDVTEQQARIRERIPVRVEDMLTIPLLPQSRTLTAQAIQQELDNNVQGILGYVVRWINQGIGCSKVPDIHNIALMEDRATLRISSQHIANWLRHGLCSPEQVRETLERMAVVVNAQNASDPDYELMAPGYAGFSAFSAACELVFAGARQPNGYTEPCLHAWRLRRKR
jgi:malate synthase